MRKFALALGTLALVSASQATEIDTSKLAVSVNPVGVLFGIGNVDVEFQAMNFKGFVPAIGGSFARWTSGDDKLTAFGIYGAGRIFSDKERLAGWFGELGLGVSYAKAENDTLNLSASSTVVFPYAMGGYRWVFGGNRWQTELGLGAGYMIGNLEANGYDFGFTGFAPTGRLAIGYRF